MKQNFTNTLLKILYVVIALTSFMLIRQYTYSNQPSANNTSNNSAYIQQQQNEMSDFYELEGE